MAISYAEKLRDPRWQRKRLEILSRSDFACEVCDSITDTLNVHHRRYRKGAEPWEYEPEELIAVCEKCHRRRHDLENALKDAIYLMPDYALDELLGFAQGRLLLDGDLFDVALRNAEHVNGLALAASYLPNSLSEYLIDESGDAGILKGLSLSNLTDKIRAFWRLHAG